MDIVSLLRCSSYQQANVDRAVDKILAEGFKDIFFPGQKIFLKANLLLNKLPEEAVTTHPAVVEALVNKLMRYGCQVVIGDSPGGPFTPVWLKTVYKATGMEGVAQRTGCSLNYNVESISIPYPEGHRRKSLTVSKAMWEADAIINVAKLKTHGMTTFTGAVKNMFGAIPGLLKTEYHFNMPNHDDFAHLLVDVYEAIKPVFSIIDGIIGMEGAGPSAGTPRETGVLIGGRNGHAVDVIGAAMIGLTIDQVPTLKAASIRKLVRPIEHIEIVGENLHDVAIADFKLPNTKSIHFFRGRLPKWLETYLDQWLTASPFFQHEKCTGCRVCEKHCPPGKIVMKNNRPEIKLAECIRCFCCQELCPEKAIEIKRHWLAEKIFK